MDREREVLAKRLEGERTTREELQGELVRLQRQTQALENVEEMLFKERAQRQRAERSIVELARSLGTLKAALLHAGLPVPPEARPSSALQSTVQVTPPPPPQCQHTLVFCVCSPPSYRHSTLTSPPPFPFPFPCPFAASGTARRFLFAREETCTGGHAAARARRSNVARGALTRLAQIRTRGCVVAHAGRRRL
jgi:hypothetical protein